MDPNPTFESLKLSLSILVTIYEIDELRPEIEDVSNEYWTISSDSYWWLSILIWSDAVLIPKYEVTLFLFW